ncbi:amino acid ABC transporter permease [Lyngbya confervoides]|uniref:Amino acid ABC transporter permease n=1 Tax=Lyngbya confervoides BDU141951 TaxID=1574623 RepID=A0ABD4T868_9CYAN|nr:amino acid ABC transporter permease [Lyngbya confervoides]MCM1984649.1 amino acid ABC transporter permease [Lyngbya confervoides BDU141951]
MAESWAVTIDALPALLRGVVTTLFLTGLSGLWGMALGSLLGIARCSKFVPLRWITRAYVDFFRGTPLLVQLFMIYFGLPAIAVQWNTSLTFDRFVAGVIALSLNSAAYIAEIVRAGIQSIEPGQHEAAQALGLRPLQVLRFVIFPQALRRVIPPLGNELITMLKDTSLVAVIGLEELFREGQLIVAQNYRAFEIYTAVALIYLVLTLLTSQILSQVERWTSPASAVHSRRNSR